MKKPEKIKVLTLLEKYKNWVEKGQIQFLKGDSKDILKYLEELINDFRKAEDEAKQAEVSINEKLDWHETHKKGRELWHKLASYSLHDIDEGSKGNAKLFEFLDAATEFEDLLYGLEPYYRDHTLHSLWVYFIGEYILRELIPNIHNNLNWYLFNDIKRDKKEYKYSKKLVEEANKQEDGFCREVNKHKDAIWCLMALCHDLGYSLAKLKNLNKKVEKVLSFLDISDFKHIGYSLDIEHQYLVSQFLELMAMDVRIVPSENFRNKGIKLKEKVLVKCYRDDSTYWRLSRALEKKEHGILSSYLIYKIIGMFADTSVRGPAEEWGLDDEEVPDNIIRGDILFAIAQHEFEFAHLNQLGSLADILVLADELEEFSRLGRQLLSRKYYDTTAEAAVCFKANNKKIKSGEDIEIEMIYYAKQKERKGFLEFFKRKAERICSLYSLEQDRYQEKTKGCNVKTIKLTVTWEKEEYYFYLSGDPTKTTGYLPKTKYKNGYPKGKYDLKCYDDKLYILHENVEISLDDWIKNID